MENQINAVHFREQIRILERKLGALEDSGHSCCTITLAQCHALVEIGRAKNLSLNELAKLLNLEISTMSRTVNHLVTGKLVTRDIDAKDRRYVTIALTDEGRRVFDSIETNMGRFYGAIFAQIPEDKKAQVLESLMLINEARVKEEHLHTRRT